MNNQAQSWWAPDVKSFHNGGPYMLEDIYSRSLNNVNVVYYNYKKKLEILYLHG